MSTKNSNDTTFDIPRQIAVKDSRAIPGFDGIFKSLFQNSTKYHDLLPGHNITAVKKKKSASYFSNKHTVGYTEVKYDMKCTPLIK
jgi:hypothetical protein